MKKILIKHVLIIRFRQIGDAVLSTVICNTVKSNFPDAEIDIVLNKNIAPLFQNHPAIDNVITFEEKERHSMWLYLCKIYRIMHKTHYDAIIDMRSTLNTLPFSILSLSTPLRIGVWKNYSLWMHNYRIKRNDSDGDMVQQNLKLVTPLEKIKHLHYTHDFSIFVAPRIRDEFRNYMESQGIEFNKPIMLVGVTAKLANKVWNEDRMVEVLKKLITAYPDMQLIFNYAPGQEEENAQRIYKKLGCPPNVFINIQAHSLCELAAMLQNTSFYFGNEGGARHIAQAMGVPSYVICSPNANKHTWIPQNNTPADGIAATDFLTSDKLADLDYQQKYDTIKAEDVWKGLNSMLMNYVLSSSD
jgi:ADP-heptose:LPS heptosyltransferase